MSDEKKKISGFGGHVKYIEDAESANFPIDGQRTFTDEELNEGGLIKASAYIRSRRSKNALRVEKHKKQKAEKGIKQLNIEVPEEYREVFKQIAVELKDGNTLDDVLSKYQKQPKVSGEKDKVRPPKQGTQNLQVTQKITQIKQDGSWLKRWLLNWLLS